jgi:hypothetical protein
MSWVGWAVIGILAANAIFMIVLALIVHFERREKK